MAGIMNWLYAPVSIGFSAGTFAVDVTSLRARFSPSLRSHVKRHIDVRGFSEDVATMLPKSFRISSFIEGFLGSKGDGLEL